MLLFVAWNSGFAQDPFYNVTYKVNLDRLFEYAQNEKKPIATVNMFRSIANTAKKVSLNLKISNNLSLFSEEQKMPLENEEGLKVMVSAFSYEGSWLFDILDQKLIFVRKFGGKDIFAQKEYKKYPWLITNETKEILGYKCRKAIFIRTVPRGEFEVSAWFTTDIPIPFGPANYTGQLPGLILELSDVNAVYTATNVEKVPRFSIKWPNEKDILTEKQYKKEGDKVIEFYKKNN
jgi:GLPGLI family protein